MQMFRDCYVEYPPVVPTQHVSIRVTETVWDIMASCSKEEYKSEDRPSKCDYQPAMCSFNKSLEVSCEVRRKGSSTWRDMDDKPSFKVKFDDKVFFGEYECEGDGYCPSEDGINRWESKKLTLNNMARSTGSASESYPSTGQVDADRIFRKYGPAPLSVHGTLSLYRGEESEVPVQRSTYTVLETVNDKYFAKKHFGDDYLLWEIENDEEEFKRGGGEFDDDDDDPANSPQANSSLINLPLAEMDISKMLYYYAVEIVTSHWDGMCTRSTNGYVAYNGSKYFYVPGGTDQTFQSCFWNRESIYTLSKCGPVNECFLNRACKDQFDTTLNDVGNSAHRRTAPCDTRTAAVVAIALGVNALLVCMFTALFRKGYIFVGEDAVRRSPKRKTDCNASATTASALDMPYADQKGSTLEGVPSFSGMYERPLA